MSHPARFPSRPTRAASARTIFLTCLLLAPRIRSIPNSLSLSRRSIHLDFLPLPDVIVNGERLRDNRHPRGVAGQDLLRRAAIQEEEISVANQRGPLPRAEQCRVAAIDNVQPSEGIDRLDA